MTNGMLKQIYAKLSELDHKVSALLVKEERPSEEEHKAIRAGLKEFSEGKYDSWETVKAKLK